MSLSFPPRPAASRPRLPAWLGITLLALVYLFVGIAHDPWRGEDVQHIDLIARLFRQENWLFPQMAGEAAPAANGPLWYWASALLTLLLGDWMPFHDAARLASPLFVLLALFHLARTANALYGEACRTPAALLVIGTLGMALPAHTAHPVTALLAAFAIALHGLARLTHRPVTAALQTALGCVLLFLADGLPALLLALPLIVLLPLLSPPCRGFRVSAAGLLALVLTCVSIALWLVFLYLTEPRHLLLWWNASLQTVHLPWQDELFPGAWLATAGWQLWPLWPIAAWTLWHNRATLAPASLLPRAALVLALGYALFTGGDDLIASLPALIVPCVLLAAASVPSLRRGAANAFDWFGTMSFTVFAILLGLLWSAANFDWPPGLARSVGRIVPEYVAHTAAWPAALALALFLCWILLLRRLPRGSLRGAANWALGITLMWLLAATLLMPLFDAHRNYRPMADSLADTLAPLPAGCIAFVNSNPGLLGALDYFAGINAAPLAAGDSTACRYLLTRNERAPESLAPEWIEIWRYRFNGGRNLEYFRLYQHR